MRAETNYIPFETFQEIVAESGLPWEELTGFVKVYAQQGRKVYIPRTQRVGRVDISGFDYPGEGVVDLGDEAYGGVKQQIDFTQDEGKILDTFVAVLQHMVGLPARARAPRGSGQQVSGGRGRPSMSEPPPMRRLSPPTRPPVPRMQPTADREPATRGRGRRRPVRR